MLVGVLCWTPGTVSAQANAAADAVMAAGTNGGTNGYRVRRLGANSPSFNRNGNFVYYPASSFKILEHFYAMALVQNGNWNLADNLDVCNSGQDQCSDGPNNGNCPWGSVDLSTTLNQMMVPSSNEATNAVIEEIGQTFFPASATPHQDGRTILNFFANGTLGMNNSSLNTKFGCVGACGTNPNTLTLSDLDNLYSTLAGNSILNAGTRIQLKDLMQNETFNFFTNIINQEAADTDRNAILPAFYAKLYYIYKGGSWTCSNQNAYRTFGGLIQLPTYSGAYKRLYSLGAFVHGTDGTSYVGGTVANAMREAVRPAIRAALLTWPGGYSPVDDIASATEDTKGLMRSHRSSPAMPYLQAAYYALQDAETAINDWRDSNVVSGPVDETEEAVVFLQLAKQADAALSNPIDSTLPTIIKAIEEVMLDAEAMLMATGDGSTFEIDCGLVNQYRQTAAAEFSAGNYSLGFQALRNAAAICETGIDWNFRGPRDFDNSIGFSPATTIAFKQGSVPHIAVEAWPNPAKESVQVRVASAERETVLLELFDLSGRKVATHQSAAPEFDFEYNFDLRAIPNGMLMLKVTAGKEVAIEKIIHQN